MKKKKYIYIFLSLPKTHCLPPSVLGRGKRMPRAVVLQLCSIQTLPKSYLSSGICSTAFPLPCSALHHSMRFPPCIPSPGSAQLLCTAALPGPRTARTRHCQHPALPGPIPARTQHSQPFALLCPTLELPSPSPQPAPGFSLSPWLCHLPPAAEPGASQLRFHPRLQHCWSSPQLLLTSLMLSNPQLWCYKDSPPASTHPPAYSQMLPSTP